MLYWALDTSRNQNLFSGRTKLQHEHSLIKKGEISLKPINNSKTTVLVFQTYIEEKIRYESLYTFCTKP